MATTMMTSRTTPSMSFKASIGSRQAFLPARAPVAGRIRQAVVAAKIPGLKNKNNIAKVKYDDSAFRTSPLESAFTRRREIFVGRLAMTGFFSAVIGELLTGKGALGQLGLETRLPQPVVNWLVIAIVGFNVVTALNPFGSTFSQENQQDVRKRPTGAVQNPKKNILNDPKGTVGIPGEFGFLKKNELFVGRVAMLGFAAELVGEVLTKGKGPIGQLGLPLGLPLNPELAGFGLAVWVGFFLVAAIGYGNFGQQEGDEGIY